MRIVATIQARMGSSRLPGKVLAVAAGKPLLQWQVERLRSSAVLDEVVVATTTSSADDEIVEWCNLRGIPCFRGSEHDVLGRVANAVSEFEADVHVECFGDSPLIDPQIVDQFVAQLLKTSDEFDYVSSALKTTYPPGFEVIAYFGWTIELTNHLVPDGDPMREHAGFNITRFPDRIRTKGLEAPPCYQAPSTYLEVDTPEDLDAVCAVLEHFKLRERPFGLGEVLDFVRDNPKIFDGNRDVHRRWKVFREDV